MVTSEEIIEAALGGTFVVGEGLFIGHINSAKIGTDGFPMCAIEFEAGTFPEGTVLSWGNQPWVIFANKDFGQRRLGGHEFLEFMPFTVGPENSLVISVALREWCEGAWINIERRIQ